MLDAVLEGAASSAPARRKRFAGSDKAEPSRRMVKDKGHKKRKLS